MTTMTIPLTPVRRTRLTRMVELTIDGQTVSVPEGTTILDACRELGIDTPVLCYGDTLTPVNACRVCVVDLVGARTLVPACSRKVEPGMEIKTDTDRVHHSRKLVLELLGSSVDFSYAPSETQDYFGRYDAHPERFGPPVPAAGPGERDHAHTGHHHPAPDGYAATVAQPAKIDNELYIRDYSRCILCYKCVEACGTDHQNTFAISIAGRGFDARVSTEFDTWLPDSACVYCGNCIEVCPTGALMFATEYELRQEGKWDEERQTVTDTICPYCGVGCTLRLHVQDNQIVRVNSPHDHDVTFGNLCVKGRFGWQHVQNRAEPAANGAGGAGS
jgi:predicted molibdopterin-dependent oxidoreductase YjgC